ncbi:hypothetical protein [Nocardia sp. alder85J]|uniref:hypothetical protein n=1 Tax=Nocardia sp. alder85J TaxID=2862949 RepID=UPI001CD7B57C|nr:hypothetical protein [Nocardia sp. alder85J]MCX4095243.1 hypothetical protein [Nocardia sp. alder85J]
MDQAPQRAANQAPQRAANQTPHPAMPTPGRKAAAGLPVVPPEQPVGPRRVAADRDKSGAAERAYAKRRNRVRRPQQLPPLPGRTTGVMAGRIPFVAGILALLGCGLAATLLLTTRAAEDSYQLGDARHTNQELADEQAALQREVAKDDSAPALADRARELGMIPAKDPVRLVVAPDGSVTVIGKEVPQQGGPVPPLNVSPTAPAAPLPRLAQAQGERVIPVTSPPRSAPSVQAPTPAVPNAVAAQAAQAVAPQAAQAVPGTVTPNQLVTVPTPTLPAPVVPATGGAAR